MNKGYPKEIEQPRGQKDRHETDTPLDDDQISPKGEFVVAVEGQRITDSSTVNIDLRQLLQEMVAVLPGSQAVDVVASLTGRGRNEVYRLMLSLAADEEE